MSEAHRVTAWLLIGCNALAGVWCLAAFRYERLRRRALWALVIVAQALAFVQATIGAILARRSDAALGDMHALYGFSAIVAVMIMYGYRTSPFLKGKELLLYGLGCLFIMGLGLRNLYLH
jgi:hypothetical protein